MPELPEVETIKNDLARTVVGETITDFSSNSPQQIIPSPAVVKKSVVGAKITGVERRAKLLLLKIQPYSRSNLYLGIHLKMTGRMLLRKPNDRPDPYTRVIITLKNKELRFCDIRKFGYVKLFKDKQELEKELNAKLGPEPFSPQFTVNYLQKILSHKNTNIKTAIMDQSLISGIGNIYANEALYLAGIKPTKKAKILGYKEIGILRDSIRKVLKKSIKYRGSSAKDESYRDLYGELGHYQNHFLVYEQKGKRCQKCQSVIEYQKVNGRGTFFCPHCQK